MATQHSMNELVQTFTSESESVLHQQIVGVILSTQGVGVIYFLTVLPVIVETIRRVALSAAFLPCLDVFETVPTPY